MFAAYKSLSETAVTETSFSPEDIKAADNVVNSMQGLGMSCMERNFRSRLLLRCKISRKGATRN